MSQRFSTALSHIVLAGTGIYCLYSYKGSGLSFPHLTFSIITANSLVGIWRYGIDAGADTADKLYKFTSFCQTIFALPCMTAGIWLQHGYRWELSYAHALVSCIPLVGWFADKVNQDLIDSILGINVISLGVVSFLAENYWGIAAALMYAVSHYAIKDEGEHYDIPAQDLYNYGLALFCFFSLQAIGAGPLKV